MTFLLASNGGGQADLFLFLWIILGGMMVVAVIASAIQSTFTKLKDWWK